MSEKNEVKTTSAKLDGFLTKHKKALIAVLCVAIVALIAVVCIVSFSGKSVEKDLSALDEISYTLTKDVEELNAAVEVADGEEAAPVSEEAVNKKLDEAAAKVDAYLGKKGIVGVRANMLAAEIAFAKKDYEKAASYWETAYSKDSKSYTAPLANYNRAVCYEELKNLDKAAESYKLAADYTDFVLAFHAKFSYGRVLEAQGKKAEAIAVYQEMNDVDPDDRWANLAKSRIIVLQAE